MSGFLCSMVGATYAVVVAEVIRTKKGITAIGNAQIDTAQSKFGGSSALFDGTGDYLTSAAGSIEFGSDNFTMEGWIYLNGNQNTKYVMGVGLSGGSNRSAFVFLGGTQKVEIYFSNSGSSWTAYNLGNTVVTANAWHHIAAVKSGTDVQIYLDGVADGSGQVGTASGTAYAGQIPYIGGDTTYQFNGWIDEVRFSKTARYTATFTPSTTAFVNDDNTVLLIHANGTDATTFFEDDNGIRASRSIVASGGAQYSTTQSKFGGTSLSLDGTGDYLNVGETGDFAFSTGNFTVEAFIRNTKASSTRKSGIFSKRNFDNINSGGWGLYLTTDDGKIGWEQLFSGGTSYEISTTISANTWYHVAVVRNGSGSNNMVIYIDGTSRATWTDTTNYTNVNQLKIGTFWDSTQGNTPTDSVAWQGFIDEMRISDSARYTTTFTPTTTPFVNDTNTLLLIHADGTNAATVFRDDNGSGRSSKGIQAVGNAQIDTAQSKFGGSSALFDGTGDYLDVAPTTDLAFGSGDFTIEFWFRPASVSIFQIIYDGRPVSTTGAYPCIYANGTTLYYNTANSTAISGGTLSLNTWTHITVSRSGTSTKMFKDGTQIGSTYTDSQTYLTATSVRLAAGQYTTSDYVTGHLDEVRISNSARYTAAFTAPTAPFQNDTNTLLLIHCDGTDASTVFLDDNGRNTTP